MPVLGVPEIDREEILKAWWRREVQRRISKISQSHAHWNAGAIQLTSRPTAIDSKFTTVTILFIVFIYFATLILWSGCFLLKLIDFCFYLILLPKLGIYIYISTERVCCFCAIIDTEVHREILCTIARLFTKIFPVGFEEFPKVRKTYG